MHRARILARQVLAVLLFLTATVATAHEIRPALAEISFPEPGQYQIAIVGNLEALVAGVGPEHEDTDFAPEAQAYNALRALPPEQFRAEFDAFAPRFLDGVTLMVGETRLAPEVIALNVPSVGDTDLPRDSIVTIGGALPAGAETLSFAWSAAFGAVVFRTYETESGGGYSAYLTGGDASDPIPVEGPIVQSAWDVFASYIVVGFDHIVPKGLDHILFVVGLFLLSTRLRPLLIQISSFTVAHTVTLALGLFGVVVVSPAIVEPLIALSIVYVAIENIFMARLTPWRPVLVFMFGLLHGLGFAGVLTEFGLPSGQYVPALIAFNIGVELGQLFVVGVCFALVGYWFGEKAWYRRVVVIPGSLIIAVIGAYWVVERTLL